MTTDFLSRHNGKAEEPGIVFILQSETTTKTNKQNQKQCMKQWFLRSGRQ